MTAVTIALFVRWLGFFAANQVQTRAWFVADSSMPCRSARRRSSIWFIRANRTHGTAGRLAERLVSAMRQVGDRMMFMRLWRRHWTRGRRRAGVMGWTLGRYFFFRYADDHGVVFPRRLRADLR